MTPATGRFRRADRLLHSRDFQRVTRRGRRVAGSGFVVLVMRQADEHGPRLGLTVSRKVGNAVVRNRVKRRIREWYRRARADFPEGGDLVVIARPEAAELGSGELSATLTRLLREAGRGEWR